MSGRQPPSAFAAVRDVARTSAAVQFDDRCDQELKGIADHVQLFAVQ
jgi:hypothetical protein